MYKLMIIVSLLGVGYWRGFRFRWIEGSGGIFDILQVMFSGGCISTGDPRKQEVFFPTLFFCDVFSLVFS
jgi:hypothetical protein